MIPLSFILIILGPTLKKKTYLVFECKKLGHSIRECQVRNAEGRETKI